jgi:hypothetical protein
VLCHLKVRRKKFWIYRCHPVYSPERGKLKKILWHKNTFLSEFFWLSVSSVREDQNIVKIEKEKKQLKE